MIALFEFIDSVPWFWVFFGIPILATLMSVVGFGREEDITVSDFLLMCAISLIPLINIIFAFYALRVYFSRNYEKLCRWCGETVLFKRRVDKND